MLERLDRSFDAQRRFVANASHELRTPLAVDRTMLEVAAADLHASADLRRIAPRLLATNERSERLVNGLLTLARSEQPIGELTSIDLAAVASAAVEHQRHEARRHGVTITTDLHPAPISGNVVLVEQLAANLIQNALRHGASGGRAVVRTWQHGGHSLLEVENPGPVMNPDEVDRLFEPFQRGNGRLPATASDSACRSSDPSPTPTAAAPRLAPRMRRPHRPSGTPRPRVEHAVVARLSGSRGTSPRDRRGTGTIDVSSQSR